MGQDHSLDTCDFLSLITPTQTQQEQPEEAAIIPRVYYPKTSADKMSGILTTKTMSLAVADEIATLAIKACKNNGFKPISICVMDPAGHEIVTKRMDGCPATAYPKISHAKATTCISTKASSRAYGAKYLKGPDGGEVGPSVFARVINQINIMQGDMAAFQGGILVKEASTGDIVGSVGVSGAAGDEDEYCALAGVKECSLAGDLQTIPEDHSCKTLK